jgi:L-threonylcarbamoyladenylate synthase
MLRFKNDIENCLIQLHNGGTILYPTDTIWGIGCDATNEKAVSKIFQLKQRNESKSMIILVAEDSDILNFTKEPSLKIYDYIKGIHKPATVIYNHAINLAKNLINEDGSIGIRIVKDDFCRELIKAFGKPIVSTSSNISGYPPPQIFSDIDVLIKNGVDYIVTHRQEDEVPGIPSTVIKMNEDGSYVVLRP